MLRVAMMHSERMRVMMQLDKMRVMMQGVEMLRMLQGTKSKVMQMLDKRVKVDEGILSKKHMVVIP